MKGTRAAMRGGTEKLTAGLVGYDSPIPIHIINRQHAPPQEDELTSLPDPSFDIFQDSGLCYYDPDNPCLQPRQIEKQPAAYAQSARDACRPTSLKPLAPQGGGAAKAHAGPSHQGGGQRQQQQRMQRGGTESKEEPNQKRKKIVGSPPSPKPKTDQQKRQAGKRGRGRNVLASDSDVEEGEKPHAEGLQMHSPPNKGFTSQAIATEMMKMATTRRVTLDEQDKRDGIKVLQQMYNQDQQHTWALMLSKNEEWILALHAKAVTHQKTWQPTKEEAIKVWVLCAALGVCKKGFHTCIPLQNLSSTPLDCIARLSTTSKLAEQGATGHTEQKRWVTLLISGIGK